MVKACCVVYINTVQCMKKCMRMCRLVAKRMALWTQPLSGRWTMNVSIPIREHQSESGAILDSKRLLTTRKVQVRLKAFSCLCVSDLMRWSAPPWSLRYTSRGGEQPLSAQGFWGEAGWAARYFLHLSGLKLQCVPVSCWSPPCSANIFFSFEDERWDNLIGCPGAALTSQCSSAFFSLRQLHIIN